MSITILTLFDITKCMNSIHVAIFFYNQYLTRSGNFIIGASGSDKQMLCASSGTRAALNIAAEKSKRKR